MMTIDKKIFEKSFSLINFIIKISLQALVLLTLRVLIVQEFIFGNMQNII